MKNLNDINWISATARMGTTDLMWSYTIQVHGNAENINEYEMLEYRHHISNYPLIRCLPTTKSISYDHPTVVTEITGYSLAIYLRNPIPLWERQSKITLDSAGNVSAYENPITYLARVWNHIDYGMIPVFQDIASDDILEKQYAFDAHPMSELISKIGSDYNRIYFEQIRLSNNTPVHKFYLINFDKIDSLLELPPQVTISAGSNYLVGNPGPRISKDLTDSKNAVTVELCRKKDNAWFYAERKTARVISGEEKPRYLVYRSTDILPDPVGDDWPAGTDPKTANFGPVTLIPGHEDQSGGVNFGTTAENAACQKITDDKANELVGYLELDVKQYEVTLRLTELWTHTLSIYQKVMFSGFDTIPSNELMRITEIEYNLNSAGEQGDVVNLVVVPDAEIVAARQFELMQNEIRSNQIALQQSIERNVINNKIGVVKSISDDQTYANMQLRSSGRMVQIRAWGERAV